MFIVSLRVEIRAENIFHWDLLQAQRANLKVLSLVVGLLYLLLDLSMLVVEAALGQAIMERVLGCSLEVSLLVQHWKDVRRFYKSLDLRKRSMLVFTDVAPAPVPEIFRVLELLLILPGHCAPLQRVLLALRVSQIKHFLLYLGDYILLNAPMLV